MKNHVFPRWRPAARLQPFSPARGWALVFLLAGAAAFAGCIRIENSEEFISPEDIYFENSWLSIRYPKGWIITRDLPTDGFDHREQGAYGAGMNDVIVFRDPRAAELAVWVSFQELPAADQDPDRRERDLLDISRHYRGLMLKGANISESARPVFLGPHAGVELVVRGEGPGNKLPEDPAPTREYHVLVFEIDGFQVRVHYLLTSRYDGQVKERLLKVLETVQIKETGLF